MGAYKLAVFGRSSTFPNFVDDDEDDDDDDDEEDLDVVVLLLFSTSLLLLLDRKDRCNVTEINDANSNIHNACRNDIVTGR